MAGTNDPNQESLSVIRAGSSPSSEGSPDNFTGRVRVQGRFQRESPARVGGATVMFEPSARTAWHTHPLGQTLIVLQGHGFVQEWQHSARAIGPGDVIWIPPGTKHWHGASAAEPMTHVAIAETRSNRSVTWMEKVSDTQYADAVSLGNGTP
ncbi:cupin domain-containing protein [Sphingomonas sp. NIBR02145]|nr:cupin domain-containing protein [Sphingomonas sp. NIBR02145]WHU05251.1 cupin domain-containing protein [Sphingomonas sp. NIBR02145]